MERFRRHLPHGTLALGLLLCALTGRANNIQVSGGVLTGITATQMSVQFDLSWENSWRVEPNRWDAAWVFVKYRTYGGEWKHASLDNTGHLAPSGSTITTGLLSLTTAYNATTNPCLGVFIYRSAAGSGTFTANGAQLRWNFAVDNVSPLEVQEVRVFAIEMVYVPPGAFAVGSGGGEGYILTTINTSNTQIQPSGTGSLGGQAGGQPPGLIEINVDYPNGINGFYCMKYEVTQQAYVDFLNTLTYTQQVTRTVNAPTGAAGTGALVTGNTFRNGIDIQVPGIDSSTPAQYACNLNGNASYGEATDGKDVACNFLGWRDLSAYLDWTSLRPMSEMEFEKACRGTILPVAGEYPWGTTAIAASAYTLANAGANNEDIATNYSTTLGNASYSITDGAINGPVRVGIMSANNSNNGRISAGASFYGIMDMAGNVHERAATTRVTDGYSFRGNHGNGVLTVEGESNIGQWPTSPFPSGACFRGGAWSGGSGPLRISDRSMVTISDLTRRDDTGGRGVRNVP